MSDRTGSNAEETSKQQQPGSQRGSGGARLVRGLVGLWPGEAHWILPGLVLAAGLGWASTLLSDVIGLRLLGFERSPISAVMTAIILGLIISNVVRLPAWLTPGLKFAVGKVLRLGIIFLGIRLSLAEIARLGALGVPIVIGCIVSALGFTLLAARVLKLPGKLATLIAVGTSICGVTAIVATGPAIDSKEEEVAYAVSVITVFGIIATVVYPYLANWIFAGDPLRAGLFLGTAVHDTSQVTGAALLYADVFSRPEALNVAVVTKLVRNVFMAAVIPIMATTYSLRERRSTRRISVAKLFPTFILGFLLFGAIRSIGDFSLIQRGAAFGVLEQESWTALYSGIRDWAVNFLVVALAGVGLSTRFAKLKELGFTPFVAGLVAAAAVGVVSYLLITVLGRYTAVV